MKANQDDDFWPAYVDALSNMVLALIFVVLILALALSQSSTMSARQMAQEMVLAQVETEQENTERKAGTPDRSGREPPSGSEQNDVASSAMTQEAGASALPVEVSPQEPSPSAPAPEAAAASQAALKATADEAPDPDLADRVSEFSATKTENMEEKARDTVAPSPVLPATVRIREDTAYRFEGEEAISVDDLDEDLTQIELSVLYGILSVDAVAGVELSGQASSALVLRGSQNALTRSLQSLEYRGFPNFFGKDSLILRASGASGRQSLSVSALTVTPVNDPPVGVASRTSALVDRAYVFSIRDFFFDDVEDHPLGAIRIDRLNDRGQLQLSGKPVLVGDIVAAEGMKRGDFVFIPPSADGAFEPVALSVTVIDAGGTEDGGEDRARASSSLTIDFVAVPGRLQSLTQAPVSDLVEQAVTGEQSARPSVASPGDESRDGTGAASDGQTATQNAQDSTPPPEGLKGMIVSEDDLSSPSETATVGNTVDLRLQPDLAAIEAEALATEASISSGSTGEIIVQFPDKVVALDEVTQARLTQEIAFLGEPAALDLTLVVLSPYPYLTIERSAAMTRAISVWQALRDSGVPSDAIEIRIERERRSAQFGEVRITRASRGSAD